MWGYVFCSLDTVPLRGRGQYVDMERHGWFCFMLLDTSVPEQLHVAGKYLPVRLAGPDPAQSLLFLSSCSYYFPSWKKWPDQYWDYLVGDIEETAFLSFMIYFILSKNTLIQHQPQALKPGYNVLPYYHRFFEVCYIFKSPKPSVSSSLVPWWGSELRPDYLRPPTEGVHCFRKYWHAYKLTGRHTFWWLRWCGVVLTYTVRGGHILIIPQSSALYWYKASHFSSSLCSRSHVS